MQSMKDRIIGKFRRTFMRNSYSISGEKSLKNRINLEWWSKKVNVGDELAKVIYSYMLERRGLSPDHPTKKTIHLMTVGSLVGMKNFDAVIWGSGVHVYANVQKLINNRKTVKLDIRAMRGPVTKSALEACGYNCKKAVMGDPAILMPDIYMPENFEKKHKISLILHIKTKDIEEKKKMYNCISVETRDYKKFINEIVQSELIISSSLHGIILAEMYGVPAVFMNENGLMDAEIMKFKDWYFSTGRENVIISYSVEDALNLGPMELPEKEKIEEMKKGLLESFPYDLWEN